ncbi:MAG: hypothetical protein MJ113_03595 [Lachnospiraceae bacterium]|nr:hypothetical protein [Lachnospiraceae bacterium]
MSKRELVLDFTSLLDVIMIILFLVVCTMSNQTIDSKEEAEKYAQIADQNQILALNLSNKNAQLESDIKETEDELAKANAVIDEMTAKILQLMKDIEVKNDEIIDLNKDLDDVHIQLTKEEQKLSDTTNEKNKYIALYEQLVKDLADKKAEIEKNNAEIKDLTSQLASAQGKLENTEDKLHSIQEELNKSDANNKYLNSEIKDLNDKLNQAEKDYLKLEGDYKVLMNSVMNSDGTVKALTDKCDALQAEVDRYKQLYNQKTGAYNDLNKTYNEYKGEQAIKNAEYENQLKEAADENSRLDEQNKALTADLADVKYQFEVLKALYGSDLESMDQLEGILNSFKKVVLECSYIEKEEDGRIIDGVRYRLYEQNGGRYDVINTVNPLEFYNYDEDNKPYLIEEIVIRLKADLKVAIDNLTAPIEVEGDEPIPGAAAIMLTVTYDYNDGLTNDYLIGYESKGAVQQAIDLLKDDASVPIMTDTFVLKTFKTLK